jgi:hypothetical protein
LAMEGSTPIMSNSTRSGLRSLILMLRVNKVNSVDSAEQQRQWG